MRIGLSISTPYLYLYEDFHVNAYLWYEQLFSSESSFFQKKDDLLANDPSNEGPSREESHVGVFVLFNE